MKKKILGVFVSLLAVVMLTTPLVGTVMAGKGQSKLSFQLILVGMYSNPVILEHGNSTHIDMPFVATGWDSTWAWDVEGDWVLEFDYLGSLYVHDMSITSETDTGFAGTGGYPSPGPYGITWTVTGAKSLPGNQITMTIKYDASTYEVTATGTISATGTMSGTWDSNTGQSGTWQSIVGEAEKRYPFDYAPLEVYIDDDPIPPELLSYSGMMKVTYNVNGGSVITVIETITITAGDGYGAGTLELQVKGNTNHGNGVGNGDNFIAFGTGAYEGVKIQGRTPGGPVTVGEVEVAPGVILPISKLERVGTVMGWP